MAAACLKIRRSVFSFRFGEIIAEVQRVPLGDLSYIEPRWDQFIPGQIEGCRARHERLGLPQQFLPGWTIFFVMQPHSFLERAARYPDRRIHSGKFFAEA
jgi:hypothetical protein